MVYSSAYIRAVEIIKRRINEGDGRWELLGAEGRMFAWIDDDGVVKKDVFMVFPAVETGPVVGSHDECERLFGIGFAEFAERVVGI